MLCRHIGGHLVLGPIVGSDYNAPPVAGINKQARRGGCISQQSLDPSLTDVPHVGIYPGLGNRSICSPCSSAGSTLTFDVVEDTGSTLTSNVSFIETLARASLKTYQVPGISLVPVVVKRSG